MGPQNIPPPSPLPLYPWGTRLAHARFSNGWKTGSYFWSVVTVATPVGGVFPFIGYIGVYSFKMFGLKILVEITYYGMKLGKAHIPT